MCEFNATGLGWTQWERWTLAADAPMGCLDWVILLLMLPRAFSATRSADIQRPQTVCCTGAYIQQQCTLSFYWRWHCDKYFFQFTLSPPIWTNKTSGDSGLSRPTPLLKTGPDDEAQPAWAASQHGCESVSGCVQASVSRRCQQPAGIWILRIYMSASLIWQADFWQPARPASAFLEVLGLSRNNIIINY